MTHSGHFQAFTTDHSYILDSNGKTLNKELLGYFSPLQMFETPWRADLKINGEDLYGREVLSQTGSARDVLGAVGCRIYLHTTTSGGSDLIKVHP